MIFGLGNPGPEYERTRHNAGFLVLDTLARREGLFFEGPRVLRDIDPSTAYDGPAAFACAWLERFRAILVKPSTWMNRSVDVVSPLARWAGAAPHDLMVVYDDLDLPVGQLRIRPGGGAGGQKGMRSILDSLATDALPRLRVGIGEAPTDAVCHVLSGFSADEEKRIDVAAQEASDALCFWLETGDLERCMTRFHSRWKQDPYGASRTPVRQDKQDDE